MMRNILGIPESSKELGGQLPLNMHLHYLNGISFDKGCFIGQELTQRTFHTGVIRRIAMPYLILNEDQDVEMDPQNFVPMRQVTSSFDSNLKEYALEGENKGTGKRV